MQSRNSWFLVLVVVLTGLSIWAHQARSYKLGLDIQGGMRLVLRMDPSGLKPEERANMSRLQGNVRRILDARVGNALGTNEGTVAVKGDDQFVIELPGATNEEQVRATMKSTAKIEVYHARNVSTQSRDKTYQDGQEEHDQAGPYIPFYRSSSSTKILPGTPEYAKILEGWEVILSGSDVQSATGVLTGEYAQPQFRFGGEGAKNLEVWSRKYNRQGEKIAFVLDGRVLNIAPIKEGAILSTDAVIDGKLDPAYVKNLVALVNSGSLPVPLKEESFQKVDPTIGKKALNQIVLGSMISLGAICVYLIIYYAFPGFVATIALMLYTLVTLTVLKWTGATFSLASITAFILSVGMAVDANILVFERVKEEIRSGRKLLTAVELGFKRALTAIIDSNVCTIITSVVVWMYGTSLVKGFATALIVGVVISFFTAVTVTRSLLVGLVSVGIGNDVKWFALKRGLFGEKMEASAGERSLKVIGRAKTFFLISGALIVPGLIAIGMGGIKPNVEFQGGVEAEFKLPADKTPEQIRQSLETAGYKGFNIKTATVEGSRVIYLTIPPTDKIDATSSGATAKLAQEVGLSAENASLYAVGPSVQKETTTNAFLGVVVSAALIVLYLAVRFGFALGGMKNGVKFGLSAVFALLHDVAFVIGAAAIVGLTVGWEISALFITAMLTVIGFSVHDTIIIFDRIRENLKRSKTGETFEGLVDKSVTQTFARSINTSMAAVFPLVVLLFVGTPTPELKFMVVTMVLGIVIGTYSSIFNASPILYLWDKAVMRKKGEKEGLMAEAQREAKIRASHILAAGTQTATVDPGQYGTIKRKKSVTDQASRVLDDDED